MLDLSSILYAALDSAIGNRITTSDPQKLRQKLYATRRADPVFEPLSFVISPDAPESELWIINRTGFPDVPQKT